MRHQLALAMLLSVLALSLPENVAAAPSYTLTVDPSIIGCGGSVLISLSLSGGTNNQDYSVTLDVQKPDGGRAVTSRSFRTTNLGSGSVSVLYPHSSFTALNGTVQTDVAGVYTVIANQTFPSNIGIVATNQFTVSCQLTVVISAPASGALVERGRKITISATVSDPIGPVSTATVRANTPSGGEVILSQTSGTPGAYSIDYQVLLYDILGTWTIQVEASDPRGNSGTSNAVAVSIVRSELIVDAFAVYNSMGVPAADFSPGETIYPFFRIRYSSGDFLVTGQHRVSVRDPAGAIVANLTAVYDSSRFGFYTSSGFTISSVDPGGSWSFVIEAGGLDDGFGNTGPTIAASARVQVVVVTSSLGSYWFVLGGLVAALGGVVVFKRYRTSLQGFEHLEQLMGGHLPRATSILLLGDPGSGKTVLSHQLLWDELESGKQCTLLSYDAFPEDVVSRMREFGWDIIPYVRKGRLKILDCYSGLTGEGQGAIRDPSDLTELNIQVTSFITKARGGAVTLILDSLTPIFNGVEAKQAINFIQTVGAKIKKTGGLLILTASQGAVPADPIAKIKSIVDGIIELSLVRSGRRVSRYLSVVKMERRKISPAAIPIEIDRERGVVFHVSRFTTIKDQLIKAVPLQSPESGARPDPSSLPDERPAKSTLPNTMSRPGKSSITPEPDIGEYDSNGLRRPRPQRRERNES